MPVPTVSKAPAPTEAREPEPLVHWVCKWCEPNPRRGSKAICGAELQEGTEVDSKVTCPMCVEEDIDHTLYHYRRGDL